MLFVIMHFDHGHEDYHNGRDGAPLGTIFGASGFLDKLQKQTAQERQKKMTAHWRKKGRSQVVDMDLVVSEVLLLWLGVGVGSWVEEEF